jgi:beta-phosphoglucomutase-like phosphatase (HAD superfamily)
MKTILLFDIDDTLLFRREVLGQADLHHKRVRAGLATEEDPWNVRADLISPRPDVFFAEEASFVYLRPGVHEALDYAKTLTTPENIHAFSASSNPQQILEATGLRHHFNKVFGRAYTEFHIDKGTPTLLKNLTKVREALGLASQDRLIMLDDKPSWISNVGPNDRVIPVPPFQPPYRLYDVQVIKWPHLPDPSDTLADDTGLFDALKTIH